MRQRLRSRPPPCPEPPHAIARTSCGLGPEIELALEVRKIAVESIQADVRDVKLMVDGVGQDVKHLKANLMQLVHNPLDVAAEKLLVPAALSLVKGLRSRKEHS